MALTRHSIGISICGLALLVQLSACSQQAAVAPARPSNVPREATWAGGVDGGNWFLCRPLKRAWNFSCAIYNDDNGSLVHKGIYVLRSVYWNDAKKVPVIQSIKSRTLAFDDYDGDDINLMNSLLLVPVDRSRYHAPTIRPGTKRK